MIAFWYSKSLCSQTAGHECLECSGESVTRKYLLPILCTWNGTRLPGNSTYYDKTPQLSWRRFVVP